MENKNVGWLIIGMAVIIVVVIFLFNNAMKEIIIGGCGPEHGPVCPMNKTVDNQTYLSLSIVAILVVIGFVLIFSKPSERVVIKKVREKVAKKKLDLSGLRKEDRDVLKIIQEQGTIFQADLIEKTGFGKAKISRILDRLEGKEIIERKRRGMTNVVVLKN